MEIGSIFLPIAAIIIIVAINAVKSGDHTSYIRNKTSQQQAIFAKRQKETSEKEKKAKIRQRIIEERNAEKMARYAQILQNSPLRYLVYGNNNNRNRYSYAQQYAASKKKAQKNDKNNLNQNRRSIRSNAALYRDTEEEFNHYDEEHDFDEAGYCPDCDAHKEDIDENT